ncbi:uncharacterized protein [Pleurodeles waltl]|uniref:uncharacterized protein isoform X1 n=1 Tax=Pleurodeles waltl TaxID=8319 RepID=UPI0037095A81
MVLLYLYSLFLTTAYIKSHHVGALGFPLVKLEERYWECVGLGFINAGGTTREVHQRSPADQSNIRGPASAQPQFCATMERQQVRGPLLSDPEHPHSGEGGGQEAMDTPIRRSIVPGFMSYITIFTGTFTARQRQRRRTASFLKRPAELLLDTTSVQGNGTVPVGRNINCITTEYNADMQWGTSSLMDYYWQCGEWLYSRLPSGWKGLYSLVTVRTPSLVVPGVDISKLYDHPMSRPTTLLRHRKKRFAEYMGTTTWEDVPQEHRLFNDAQLFFGSIFPFVQTKATARWLQITRWELMKTINATEDGFNAVKEEMQAVRVMLMQHRYVLDLMTAMEGGVCAKIGTACFTCQRCRQWNNHRAHTDST